MAVNLRVFYMVTIFHWISNVKIFGERVKGKEKEKKEGFFVSLISYPHPHHPIQLTIPSLSPSLPLSLSLHTLSPYPPTPQKSKPQYQ